MEYYSKPSMGPNLAEIKHNNFHKSSVTLTCDWFRNDRKNPRSKQKPQINHFHCPSDLFPRIKRSLIQMGKHIKFVKGNKKTKRREKILQWKDWRKMVCCIKWKKPPLIIWTNWRLIKCRSNLQRPSIKGWEYSFSSGELKEIKGFN